MIRHSLIAAAVFAQLLPAGNSSGTAPVSPSVMATYMCALRPDRTGTLELLVLWRGTPGWFRKGGGAGGSGSSGSGSVLGAGPGMVYTEWLSQGGVTLQLRLDPQSRRLWIQDQEFALNDHNVVLVDDVDGPAPRVVQTLRIDPAFDAPGVGPPPVQTFIRRSPEAAEFLRCSDKLPGASTYEQQVFDKWCQLY